MLIGLLLALLSDPANQTSGKAPLPFLIGAEWSQSATQPVKDLFLETGCNFVRLTGGGYGWATPDHLKALQYLQPYGIKALVQLGSHYPDGKYLDNKADYFVDDQGKSGERKGWAVSYSDQDWPQMSYASDGYREGLTQDFTTYLETLKPNPNIAGLLLHNEPGYFWVDGRIFDYNLQAIEKFRKWLPSQYGSIDELNKNWGASFASFATVDPPHQRPPVSNIASWMDWRRFNASLIQDFLGWEAGLANRVCPTIPNMTNLSGPLDNWYPLRLGDNYKFASASDAACIDIYPTEWSNRFFEGFSMDMAKGVAQDRPVVVAECESFDPKSWTGLTDPQLGQLLKCELWTYIGHGARGVLIWTLNSNQGFQLTDGTFNSRMGVLRETAHLAKMIGLDDFSRPKPEVALCVDQDAFLYFGGLYPAKDGSAFVQQDIQGVYAGLVQSGHQVEIISADEVRAGKAARYKALVMACPAITDKPLAQALTGFVKGGGTLIAESPFAQWDRWGRPVDFHDLGLDSLFGLRVGTPGSNQAGGPGFDWTAHYKVDFQGAAPASQPGAAFVNVFGKGRAILLDRNIGIPNNMGTDPTTARTLDLLLQQYGALSPARASVTSGSFVDTSYLTDSRGNTLFVFTDPADKKSALTAQSNVKVPLGTATGRLFEFGSAQAANGNIVAGAFPISAGANGEITLPVLDSAEPILAAKDHTPLLTLESPTTGIVGKPLKLRLTVWNPSPSVVAGTVSVSFPGGWSVSSAPVKIAAGSQQVVTLTLVPKSPAKRAVIEASLRISAGRGAGESIPGVPMDLEVGG